MLFDETKKALQAEASFLTDGGTETSLIYQDGFDLPFFASCYLLNDEKGYEGLKRYYRRYLEIAARYHMGFILESPTWRANPDWLGKLGYEETAILSVNKKAIDLMLELKKEFENRIPQIMISGCIGPRGDGYKPGDLMTIDEAANYHSHQLKVLKDTPVNMVTAITMNYLEEAAGIVKAAAVFGLPVVISFTLETDGRLVTGTTLQQAIADVDACCDKPPLYFMINCAHPTHFLNQLEEGDNSSWIKRIGGVRANASCKSHAELDEATELDSGDPRALGSEHLILKKLLPNLKVFGGCCGTDERHVQAIAEHLTQHSLQAI